MTQASTVLWQAFLQGPDALAGVDDVVLADRIALEDLNTAVSAFEGNVALEGREHDGLRVLHDAAVQLRGRLASGNNLNPEAVRATLSDLQKGVLRLPADQRERALARVRRPIFATSFADLRPAILATLVGAGGVELTDTEARNLDDQLVNVVEDVMDKAKHRVLEREMWRQFPGEHVYVVNGKAIVHHTDPNQAHQQLVSYQQQHGPTTAWHFYPEGTPRPGPSYRRFDL